MAKVEKKDEESLSSMDDAELSRMQKRATARAGGVAGDAMPVAVAEAAKGAASVPAHLQPKIYGESGVRKPLRAPLPNGTGAWTHNTMLKKAKQSSTKQTRID